jgi:hypothetical protein
MVAVMVHQMLMVHLLHKKILVAVAVHILVAADQE